MTGLRRYGPLIAVVALLLGAAFAATMASPQIHRAPLSVVGPQLAASRPGVENDAQTGPPQQAPQRPSDQPDSPAWLSLLAQVLCLVLVVAAVAVLIWYLLRQARRRPVPEPETEAVSEERAREEVLAAVDAGLVELADDETDPRRAVIACWVRLEQAAAAAGTPRQPGDTPTELVTRLLAAHRVSAGVLYALAEVYRLARYATHAVDSGMRDQARAALGQLRAELSRAPVPS